MFDLSISQTKKLGTYGYGRTPLHGQAVDKL